MSLPADGVNANTLAETTTIPTGKKLIFLDPDTNEGGIITLENLTKQILSNLTSQTFNLDQGNKTLLAALNELNSNKIANAPTVKTDVKEYILALPGSKLFLFRTTSNTPGAAATGSCIYMFYMFNEKINGVGLAISYSTPYIYYVRLEDGDLTHIALS